MWQTKPRKQNNTQKKKEEVWEAIKDFFAWTLKDIDEPFTVLALPSQIFFCTYISNFELHTDKDKKLFSMSWKQIKSTLKQSFSSLWQKWSWALAIKHTKFIM